MRIPFIAAAVLSIACADASGQAYRWVDKEGKVHYTQAPPPPDARAVQKKTFRHGPAEASNLPYATQVAAKNFPVTLHFAGLRRPLRPGARGAGQASRTVQGDERALPKRRRRDEKAVR